MKQTETWKKNIARTIQWTQVKHLRVSCNVPSTQNSFLCISYNLLHSTIEPSRLEISTDKIYYQICTQHSVFQWCQQHPLYWRDLVQNHMLHLVAMSFLFLLFWNSALIFPCLSWQSQANFFYNIFLSFNLSDVSSWKAVDFVSLAGKAQSDVTFFSLYPRRHRISVCHILIMFTLMTKIGVWQASPYEVTFFPL